MAYRIAVLPGDGIGPEVMREALKVLDVVEESTGVKFERVFGHIGGEAYDKFQTPFPEETRKICDECDAVLLGSVGGKKWDSLPPQLRPEIGGLLALRKFLNLYANLRPIKVYPSLAEVSPLKNSLLKEGVDLITVRELSSGIYYGQPRSLENDKGIDTMVYERNTVERIARTAFELARTRKKKVTSVDKANVLYSSMLWRRVVEDVGKEYPDVTLEHMYVDNAAMQLILNPSQFDVILTTNMFGDILSDESAALAGSLGMLPSASFGDKHLYEPAGGSAPDIAGKNMANPIAQILSLAMMLEHSFHMTETARKIEKAVEIVIDKGYRTRDIAGSSHQIISTSQMGDAICQTLTSLL
ncbi:MAG: 3-isopropylmalate dehydrogenase [Thermotogota bacterium]|nr:3-isopropylmalate dehydrogenase [Thermotogota bacterium]MDK2864922.1 3-isopropylmalate dehydrogenase [Thermotogota bacterium]HCZ05965.1 3-isopropylmalate dehydrogenase [Thermotogota bacterium]